MVREEELKTITGQTAWACYRNWLQTSKRYNVELDTFLESSVYPGFMKFAKFAKQAQLADMDAYVKIMVTDTIPPNMWTLPEAHYRYLERLDRLRSPMQMVNITVSTLFDLSDEHDTTISKLFDVLSPNEVIILIQRRKLSPWLLLKSPKFIHFYTDYTSSEERIILDTLIRFDFWYEKFATHKKENNLIKSIVVELNL